MSTPFSDSPKLFAEYDKAARTILCDCGCHPQSVHDCACGRAEEMRGEIAAQIRQGQSGDDVIAAYVARYGEKIRVTPTASGFNLVAWVAPGIGFVVAALLLVVLLRRWRRGGLALAGSPATAAPPLDAAMTERLDREMKDYE